MEPFVRLNPAQLRLAPDTRLLKSAQYQAFVGAHDILATAREEADNQQLNSVRTHEREALRGYEEGVTKARMEMAARMLETTERTVDYLGQVEHRLVDLVMMAVRKLLGEFDDFELTCRVVRQALDMVRNQPRATIRVTPDQASLLRERLNELLAGYAALGIVEVVADPRLGPNGCILETEIGVVEASLTVQLQALDQALRARLQSHPEHANSPSHDVQSLHS